MATIKGTNSSNTLNGTPSYADYIYGYGSNDTLNGNGGRRDNANEPWVIHEENLRVPEGLNHSERDEWSRMKKRRTAILRKIVVLLGKQIYGAPLKSLPTAVLEGLINEAEELTDAWEEVATEDLPPRPTTKLQRLLANHWEIREEMMGIVDAAFERVQFDSFSRKSFIVSQARG